MKKLFLCALFALGVFGVVGLNAENLSGEQDNQLIGDCLDNENVSSCQRLANSGNLISIEQCDKETCNDIGLIFDKAQNYQQALKYYKKACELNDGFGCFNLGILYSEGLGVKQDFAEAFGLYKKACELNYMIACYNLANAYRNKKGTKQDFASARKYYEKACNANYAKACNNLGLLYEYGRGVKQNKTTAKKYYGKACDLSNQKGCDNYRLLNEQGVK